MSLWAVVGVAVGICPPQHSTAGQGRVIYCDSNGKTKGGEVERRETSERRGGGGARERKKEEIGRRERGRRETSERGEKRERGG